MAKTTNPLVSMRLTKAEVDELKEWATRRRYTDVRGPLPGGIARDLFREVWPLLIECDFDPDKVKSAIAAITNPRKKGNQGR